MAIEMVKCRAEIEFGGIVVRTPYVQNFNVTKSRSQFSTFSASLKVSHDDVRGGFTGSLIKIRAGVDNRLNKIFTGYIKNSTISPCYDDPKYVVLNLNGADVMSMLQGKSYTRRSRATKGTWVTIDSLVTPGLKSGKFTYTNEPTLETSTDKPSSTSSIGVSDLTLKESVTHAAKTPGGTDQVNMIVKQIRNDNLKTTEEE